MDATQSEPEKLYTADEAAELLRTLPGRLTRLARNRGISCVVLPRGEIRFSRQDISDFIERQRQQSEGDQ